MTIIRVPNSIALRNFDTIFIENSFEFPDKSAEVIFHPKYVAMHPVGLAFYAAIGDYFRMNEIKLSGKLNRKVTSIPFLQRMGLFEALGFSNPNTINEHEECGRFIPLQKVRDSTELNVFLKTIDPLLHTTPENSRVIKHVFSELHQKCY